MVIKTDQSGTAGFIICFSLSLTYVFAQCAKWMHWFNLHKNNVALVTFSWAGYWCFSDWTVFRPQIGHPLLLTPPVSIYAKFWYVCASVKPDGLWVPQSSRTVWGVTQSAESVSQPAHTVNSPVTGMWGPFGNCLQIGFPPQQKLCFDQIFLLWALNMSELQDARILKTIL